MPIAMNEKKLVALLRNVIQAKNYFQLREDNALLFFTLFRGFKNSVFDGIKKIKFHRSTDDKSFEKY